MLPSSGLISSAAVGRPVVKRPLLRARLQPGTLPPPDEPRRDIAVALCVPLGGSAGIWGPSAMASARLAVAELNRESGILGRGCRLLAADGQRRRRCARYRANPDGAGRGR